MPYLFLNVSMTLDGKIATKSGDVDLSSEDDWKIVHTLRNQYQAIMIGGNTAKEDNPKLIVNEKYLEKSTVINNPTRIVIDSKASIHPDANFLTYKPEIPTIIGVSEQAKSNDIEKLREVGAIIIQTGKYRVDIKKFLTILKSEHNIENIMVEGGGTLIWSLISLSLINKFRIFISPKIAGGDDAISLVRGEGFESLAESPDVKFTNVQKFGGGVVIEGFLFE